MHKSLGRTTITNLKDLHCFLPSVPVMASKTKRQMNWGCFFVCWAVSLGQIAFGYPGMNNSSHITCILALTEDVKRLLLESLLENRHFLFIWACLI